MKTNHLTLMKGLFSAKDALDILMNAFARKIQFHEMKNFSAIVREGKEDAHSLQRIEELQKCKETILEIIKEAEKNESLIDILTEVRITVKEHSKILD